MATFKSVAKYLLALLFMAAGVNHFLRAALYAQIMPPYLPWHLFLIYLSGFFEIALGLMLLARPLTRVAAWGLIAFLLAVFPANIHMALHPQLFPTINPALLWLRLPLQAVLIAWAYWFTRPDLEKH